MPFTRVSVLGNPDVAAAAGVVEPLIHLVAELLANATQSSPPATQVQVAVRTVQRGAVVEIDDGGVGMDEHRLEAAREIASGRRPVGLGELGEIPQTGLAVAGQYARRHSLRVDLMPSAYGGVRVVVLVPGELTEILEPAGVQHTEVRAGGSPGRVAAAEAEPGSDAAPRAGLLPQRQSRRGQAMPAPAGADADTERRCGPDLSPEEAGAWMCAYLDGQAGSTAGTGAGLRPAGEAGTAAGEAGAVERGGTPS